MEALEEAQSHSRDIMLIRTLAEAEVIVRQRRFHPNGRLVFRIPDISPDMPLRWERELNQAFDECGCVMGARCALLALCLAAARRAEFHLH